MKKSGNFRQEPPALRKKKAQIIEVWREKVRNRPDPTWTKVAKDCGFDYKWLCDFINDGVLADQVYKVLKLNRYFHTEDMDLEQFRSEKIDPVEDGEKLL